MLSQNTVVKAKAALEKGYIGTAKVYEYVQQTSQSTHITSSAETLVLTDIPCRLSFSQAPKSSNADISEKTQLTKLFYDPAYTIKAGSKIVVTQNSITTAYMNSGEEIVYGTHKEVNLELFERWA